MTFKRLSVVDWRQFSDVDIEFHPRITIIAGANGAGKSTILRVLSQHFGISYNLIATPKRTESGILSYFTGLIGRRNSTNNQNDIGQVTYSDNSTSQIYVPSQAGAIYNVNIPGFKLIPGLFINSHRPISVYQSIGSIPTNAINVEQAYQSYNQEVMNKYNNNFSQFSPTYRIKEAIISMATFGPGNQNVQGNPLLSKHYDEFKVVLSKILPESIGFEDINIRIPDVVIVTRTGEFVLDAASGGLMALIDIAWQIFLYSRNKGAFVVVLDEPENHLHPSMQRVIIGNLIEAFPNAQIIVATHSPFIVSSVRDSFVYVLRYRDGLESEGPRRAVYSVKLNEYNKAGTASEILRSVLGVPVTMPLWAESEIEKIIEGFDIQTLNAGRIAELRSQLERIGMGEFYSEALGRIAQKK